MHLTYNSLIDAVLAYSALRGDITGRGHLLVDNDQTALLELLSVIVPSTLSDLGISHVVTDEGVEITATHFTEAQLVRHIFCSLLRYIGRLTDIDMPDVSISQPITDLPYITPSGP